MKLDYTTATKILGCFRTSGCRKSRNRFKNKKFVVLMQNVLNLLQNILSNRQIAADKEEKWANQGDVLLGGINRIYLSLLNKWKPCYGAINSRPRNLRTALKKYFQFQWICKQLRIEARNSMANCEIYFPIFSETVHAVLKIFPQHDLRKVR